MIEDNLRKYRDEILKAEIGSLLFNLGKTHIGIGFWRKYFPNEEQKFSSYKVYYKENNNKESYFRKELEEINSKLKDFIFKEKVEINNKKREWIEFFKGSISNYNLVKKVFFRGCENINSGIDKGSPKEQLNSSLWISNAFGGYIKDVYKYYFDEKRKCFFIALNEEFEKNNWFKNPNWKEIRKFVLKEIKNWYSNLLSDSRFPINDVTLFDQAYMSSTMFKSALAEIIINPSKKKDYINKPQTIKWKILGIQYDKLALAEKGLKPAHISWYRKASKEVEDKIKEIIEIEYPLGNEIYRDETGIYFLVPESFDKFQNLKNENKIYNEIIDVFSEKFKYEVYPHFALTEPSRGIMNLTKLLDDAKKNFLKPDLKPDLPEKIEKEIPKDAIGICQVCQIRGAVKKEEDDETLMCDICRERRKGRIENWIQNQEGETIWTGEVADENGRIALMTLKFELKEWLTGRMLNSLLTQKEDYKFWLEQIKTFIKLFYSDFKILNIDLLTLKDSIDKLSDKLSKENSKLSEEEKRNLGKKKGSIKNIIRDKGKLEQILKDIRKNKLSGFKDKIQIQGDKNDLVKLMKKFITDVPNLIENIENIMKDEEIKNIISNDDINKLKKMLEELKKYRIDIFLEELSEDAYNGCKNRNENFNDYIRQIFFASIIETPFEKKIKKSSLNEKIDWDMEIIKWDELTEEDIEFLSKLILQFLLRKNPSPARLRRIWESTKNFLEEVKRDILGSITDIRTKEKFENIIQDLPENLKNMILEKIQDKVEYKKYFSIIDPTPISWQFIIPANKTNEVIEKIQKLYYKHFKYVNGKLPLHIGVVVQDYKKPLYVGIKALRNIRRDIKDWKDIKTKGKIYIECCDDIEKISNNPREYYSLYEIDVNPDYEFLNLPVGKGVKNYNPFEEFIIYPNTIDFEFLDTNSRRNDIYYDYENENENGKRAHALKSNRPYIWEEWIQFKAFKEEFKNKPAVLHRLVSLIYSKLQDWESNEDSFKKFMESTFKRENIDVKTFGIKDYSFKEMKKFLDMFEYYHTTLKEI